MKFHYKKTAHITATDISRAQKKLATYFEHLKVASQDATYTYPEAPLYVVQDTALRKQIKKLASELCSRKTKEVMVVGIGGSNLGTWAVYDAVRPKGMALSFYDTVYSTHIAQGIERIKQVFKQGDELLINIVSKSGTTNETVAVARVLISALKKVRKKDWHKFMVVTTEPGSKLDAWAQHHGIASLPNPPTVGGRYSVMSAVGLFPLYCAGVDIDALHKGARDMRDTSLSVSASNPALQSATALFSAYKKGIAIENVFIFNPDLERVGKWYRQLLAESLGKEFSKNGKKKVHAGITPMVSMGSVDLHSTAQLYLGGPEDKITTFVSLPAQKDIAISHVDTGMDDLVSSLNKKSLNDVMCAIYEGTKGSYTKRKLPFMEVVLEKQSEQEIGAFMQFKMIQTMLLGVLMDVNAFDQPNVEEYKVITRKVLGG